jgi:hypothetical protein
MFAGTNIQLIRQLLDLGSLLYPLHLQFGYLTQALLSYTIVATVFCRIGRIGKAVFLLLNCQGTIHIYNNDFDLKSLSKPVYMFTKYFHFKFMCHIVIIK